MKDRERKNRGFTLVETLVAMAILGAVVVAVSQGLSRLAADGAIYDRATQLEELRYFIRHNLDCTKSTVKSGDVCSDGSYVDLYDIQGTTLSRGNEGKQKLADDFSLRGVCLSAAGLGVRIEYRDNKVRQAPWQDLYDGIPLACCRNETYKDETKTFNRTQIAAILAPFGFPSNGILPWDGFHATIICDAAGYRDATAVSRVDKDASCASQVRAVRRRFLASGWQLDDACASPNYLSTVTCRYRRIGGCDASCPETFGGSLDGTTTGIVSTHRPEQPAYYMGSSICLTNDGQFRSDQDCPQVRADAASLRETCDLLGYDAVDDFTSRGYSSCGDNSITYYDPGTDTFVKRPACGANNVGQKIICSKPRFPDCLNRY